MKGVSQGLNTEKLRAAYRRRLRERTRRIYEELRASREDSVKRWTESLLSAITEHIVEFNPDLRNQSEIIREETERIRELEERQRELADYTEEIHRMMDWREAE